MRYTELPADFLDRLQDLLCTVRTEQIFMRSHGRGDQLERIIKLAVQQTDAAAGMLLLRHEDRGDLQVAAAMGEAVEPLLGQYVSRLGITGFAMEEGNPVAVADRPGDARSGLGDEIDERTGMVTRSILAVPLLTHGQPCGALELRNHGTGPGFGPEHIELVTELAYLAAAAVEEYRSERFLFALFAGALPSALAAERGPERDGLARELERWLAELRQTPAWRRQIELAGKVRELCRHGEDAIDVAAAIIDAIVTRERRRESPME